MLLRLIVLLLTLNLSAQVIDVRSMVNALPEDKVISGGWCGCEYEFEKILSDGRYYEGQLGMGGVDPGEYRFTLLRENHCKEFTVWVR